jgi:hypothetical protein
MAPVRGAKHTTLWHLLAVTLVAVVGAFLVADVASAQGYPPPTNTPTPTPNPSQPPPTSTPRVTATPKINNCARTGMHRKNNNFTATSEFTPGSNIVVKGKSKCAKANAKVTIKLDGRKIGSGEATKSGSYTIVGKIPKSTSFGPHTLTVVTGKKTYSTVIQVVPSSEKESSGFATAGPIFAAWMALAGVIAAFFVGSRRRREPVLAVAAAPESSVPYIDTSHFVPTSTLKPKRRRKPATKKKSAPRAKAASAKKKTKAKAKPSAKAKPVPPKAKASKTPKAASKDPKAKTTRSTPKKPSAKGRATTARAGSKSPTGKPGQRKNPRPKR